jgi:hypothetical protein
LTNLMKRLEKLYRRFFKWRKGHRQESYEFAAEVYQIADLLTEDNESYRMFVKHSFWPKRKDRPARRRRENPKSLIFFTMDFMTQYRDPEKIYKKVRGLEYLQKLETPACEVVEKVVEAGGWEKLYGLAVADDPRRAKPKPVEVNDWGKMNENADDESTESLSILVKPELVEAAREVEEGSKLKAILRRLSGELEFEVVKIVPLKAGQKAA